MEKLYTIELTMKQAVVLAAALGNASRGELHEAIEEDYGKEAADFAMPLPDDSTTFTELLELIRNDVSGPTHTELDAIVRERF